MYYTIIYIDSRGVYMDLDTYKFKIKILRNMINSLNEYNTQMIESGEIKLKNNSVIIDNMLKELLNIEKNIESNTFKEKVSKDITQEEIDTLEYKKNYSLLNKSFWEAREKVAEEKIKYPSSLYEKKVKEYQNQFLIDGYNLSLEEIEYNIDLYKEKYASRIYMDSIYDRALYKIKEDNDYSIDEICDESIGVSLLDKTVYEILSDELVSINNQLLLSDDINNSGFKEVSDYKRELNNKKLIDKKNIIKEQMEIISNKAKEMNDII